MKNALFCGLQESFRFYADKLKKQRFESVGPADD